MAKLGLHSDFRMWNHIVGSITVPISHPDLSAVGIVIVPPTQLCNTNRSLQHAYDHSSFYASIGERSTLGAVLNNLAPDTATVY